MELGCLEVGVHEKNELTEGFPLARYVQVWGRISGPSLPHENMNLGLAAMQFPAVLAGLLQSLLSRYSITFSILPPPQPNLFPCNFG